ncbi:MAG: Ig-like domain-containing protein [Oscillochloridaceae bacterium]|nr:Ig-like domain-containing protein [Chloroflexaceae bacterium]MDW8390366.1 Ig-like domain-containing protein [Oscillochloridaceae bacterium]
MLLTPSLPASVRPRSALWRLLLALLFTLPLLRVMARPTASPLPVFRQSSGARGAETRLASTRLDAADWAAVRRLLAPPAYHLLTSANGYRAANPRQGWRVSFAPDGTVSLRPDQEAAWQWRLRFAAYGYREPLPLTRPMHVSASGLQARYVWSRTVTEWWVNRPDGLKQGFTLERRPEGFDGRAPLRLWLAPEGDLRPALAGEAVRFLDRAGNTVLHYHTLQAWDATGREVAGRIEVRDGHVTLALDDAAAIYPLTIDPVVQTTYLKAANASANDEFAYTVAVDGDTIVVGARFEDSGNPATPDDNSAQDTGAVYVFARSGATWTQQAYLKAALRDPGDDFGFAVAIDGDTLVVGASGEQSGIPGNPGDNSADDSGAAYVFVRNGTAWSQQAYLKASNPGVQDYFGRSVAISGNTIVVGAYNEDSGNPANPNDNSASNAGAAYVFVRNGTTWSQQAYLKADNAGTEDQFGRSVAIAGDTIVVGAPYEDSSTPANPNDNGANNSGAAYVFTRSGATWTQRAYLKASSIAAGDQFGYAVALDGNTLVIGAPGEGGSGAAYVFTGSSVNWTQQAYLKAANAGNVDYFGAFVAIDGDILAVGAPGEDSLSVNNPDDNSATDAGAAYVFTRSGATWTQRAYLKAANAQAGDLFGTSTAIAGATVVVGAPYEDGSGPASNENAPDAGAAYVFLSDDVAPGVTVEQAAGQPDPAASGPILFTATFSEPIDSSTFTPGDVTLGGTAGGPLSAALTRVNATTFTIAVSGMRSGGTVTASIPAGAVTDLLGNPNTASTSSDNTVTFEYRALLPLVVR